VGLGAEAQAATPRGADPSAHLGGSSNYKSGEPFGLMWRRFSCRLCLGMSDPVLREWRRSVPCGRAWLFPGQAARPGSRKGCWLTFQRLTQPYALRPCRVPPLPLGVGGRARGAKGVPGGDIAATRQAPGDACGRDGECLLFLLTARGVLRSGLPRDQVPRPEERVLRRPPHRGRPSARPSPPRKPLKTTPSAGEARSDARGAGLRKAVPETAAGLQGELPLVKQDNVGKGSRQTSSVTSGEGVALRAACGAAPVGVWIPAASQNGVCP